MAVRAASRDTWGVGHRNREEPLAVSEAEYWESLRSRVNRLSAGKPHGWCDWFEPRKYDLDGPSPRITGRVGFVSGRDAAKFEFTLFLAHAADSLTAIEWATLLPPDGTTGWLSCDIERNRIEIDPSAGVAEAS
jgi:hypothetical protein